jgi:hypothetical protein
MKKALVLLVAGTILSGMAAIAATYPFAPVHAAGK